MLLEAAADLPDVDVSLTILTDESSLEDLLRLSSSLSLLLEDEPKKQVMFFCQAGVSRGQYEFPPLYFFPEDSSEDCEVEGKAAAFLGALAPTTLIVAVSLVRTILFRREDKRRKHVKLFLGGRPE